MTRSILSNLMSIFARILDNKTEPNTTKNYKRKLTIESLESRELLSVNPIEFSELRDLYSDLILSSDMNDYNIIEITASQLSQNSLQKAIAQAATTTKKDLIVVRNDLNKILDLGDGVIDINIDSSKYGSVNIVSLGQNLLQIQSSSVSGVLRIFRGEVSIGGVVITSTSHASLSLSDHANLLQVAENATVKTNRVIKVVENINRAGNYTILDDTNNAENLQPLSGGSPIGSKSYSITVDIDGASGSLEAYLTGLTEAEKNSIVGGSLAFLNGLTPFDAEKNGDGDTDHCWAGTSANMLAYTGWGNVNGFQTEDDIFDYFRSNFTDDGGRSFYGNEWFITGAYTPTGWSGWSQLSSVENGAFYPNKNMRNFAQDNCTVASSNGISGAVDKLKSGAAVGLSIGWYNASHQRAGGHAITMWGVVYDTSKQETDNNYYVSLLVSDSDDNKFGGAEAVNKLKELKIQFNSSYSQYYFTNYSSGGYLENYTWLSQYSTDQIETLQAPTNFRQTNQNSNTVQLAWDVVAGATGYLFRYRTDSGSVWSNLSIDSGSANSMQYGMQANTTYEFQICAVKGTLYSDWVSISVATNITSSPSAPTNFRSLSQMENAVKLAWSAVQNASSYTLQYKKSTDSTWTTWSSNLQASQMSDTITGLTANTSYNFRIQANNNISNSSWSNTTVSTKVSIMPTMPSDFRCTAQTANSITLAWQVVDNALNYTLQYKKSTDQNWTTWSFNLSKSQTYETITGLDAVTLYDFRIFATNNAGNSESSQITISTTETRSTVVTTISDVVNNLDGVISLREAILYAYSNDTITFDEKLKGSTLKLMAGELTITKNLSINASDWNIIIDADNKSSIFHIQNSTVSLIGLSICNGYGLGGGIYSEYSVLTIIDSFLYGNNSWHDNPNAGGGAIRSVSGTLNVIGSSIYKNKGGFGGGIAAWGDNTITKIVSSLIYENEASRVYENDGGGIYCEGNLEIVNTVISKNIAAFGGGVYYSGGSFYSPGTASIINSTITQNSATENGGGIYNGYSGTMTLCNSIVVDNITNDIFYNKNYGTVIGFNNLTTFMDWDVHSSNNYVYDPSKPLFADAANGDYSLIHYSQALDRGNNSYISTVTSDIASQIRIMNGTVDIGAYEFDPATLYHPQNLRQTNQTQTTLTVTWNAVDGADGYVLQRRVGDGDFVTVYEGDKLQFIDSGLSENSSYSYRVKATKSGGSSPFSEILTTATAPKFINNTEKTDSPTILSAINDNGKTTVTWTDLGADYRYLVYKDGVVVINFETITSYEDTAPKSTSTYYVYAYNDKLLVWSWAVPVVVHSTAPAVEITGYEITEDGNVKLTWNGDARVTSFIIYNSGVQISGSKNLQTTEWVDVNSIDDNQYQIYYVVNDGTWAWSNLFFVKKPTTQSAANNNFWAEYALSDDNLLTDLLT